MYDTTLYFSGRLDFITFGFFKSHKAPCWTPSYIDIDLSYNSAAAGSDHKSAQILKSKEKFCFLRWFAFSVLRSDTFISFLNFEQFPETKTAAAALGAGVSVVDISIEGFSYRYYSIEDFSGFKHSGTYVFFQVAFL